MELTGCLLIGGEAHSGSGPVFRGFDPAARAELAPGFAGATAADIDLACGLAEAAFVPFSQTAPEQRARLLEAIAINLEADGEAIVVRAMQETGLPEARLRGELGRTTGQLRLFARVVRDGAYLDVRIDPALPERTPPRPDIRLVNQPLGPVVVFGASNFPLAFSVAGGDTASALAAGCPVIVKAHPAHPGTSELAGLAIQRAVATCDLPCGVFALLFDSGIPVGTALVADRRIQAVGFTGSRSGGTALIAIAQARRQPIPVYAEMSSINPVVLLPGALAERGEAIGRAFAGALTLGAGQFCTNPGLVFALDGSDVEAFVGGVRAAFAEIAPGTMLTRGIHQAYDQGVAALDAHARAERLLAGPESDGLVSHPALFQASAADLIADAGLRDEVFGACALLVRCRDIAELKSAIAALEGQLTAAIHAGSDDLETARDLLPALQRKAGRVLFNSFGTGVEVCDAIVHGGPYPATGDGRSTSVGSLAIARWLRPVCYQDVPAALLPPAVRDDNPWGVPQRVGGQMRDDGRRTET